MGDFTEQIFICGSCDTSGQPAWTPAMHKKIAGIHLAVYGAVLTESNLLAEITAITRCQ